MNVTPLQIPEVLLVEPDVFTDERGFFYESYNEPTFHKLGITTRFVQDNHSRSMKGVLRGLHFQQPPFAQAKLVRVTQGEVFDVAVDVRKNSPTYGKWVGEILSVENKKMMFIPEGFAHGFLVLKDNTEFQYKCSQVYSAQYESGLIWNDPDIGVAWPIQEPTLSAKDQALKRLKDL